VNNSLKNVITHEEYVSLSIEQRKLYKNLHSLELLNFNMNSKMRETVISANYFNELKNKNTKNSYCIHKTEQVGIQSFIPSQYRKKIYILKSYQNTLDRQKTILEDIVITESQYEELLPQNKEKYIKIYIKKKNIFMFFKKKLLVINEDLYRLNRYAQEYYEKITLTNNLTRQTITKYICIGYKDK
jgi:hypothetical protein